MSTTLVSICLPTLNSSLFLERRLKSIAAQTLDDYEVVVVDGYSSDDTLEKIQQYADSRYRIYRFPAKGIYNALNQCVKLSKGKYIYFAMSDDTMEMQCLELLTRALETNLDCSIAHCGLTVIDQYDQLLQSEPWEHRVSVAYFGDLIERPHIRLAPHDGLLTFALGTVYTSLTQLLIRKELFKSVGEFSSEWGSFGDFEWQMRAGLVSNTVHVPERLATWRKHSYQASSCIKHFDARRSGVFGRMVDSVIGFARANELGLYPQICHSSLRHYYWADRLTALFSSQDIPMKKKLELLKACLTHPKAMLLQLWESGEIRYNSPSLIPLVRRELSRLRIQSPILLTNS